VSNIFVPDASVLLKWALRGPEENDTASAAKLLDGWMEGRFDIVLPKLWAYEIGNVLWVRNPSQAEELMDIFIGYSFREVDLSPAISRRTYSLTRTFRVSFYDAVYHAVALMHEGILITADADYHRRAAGIGQIQLLRNFPFPS
jgi:predicted nucleic acid-binding protein